MSSKTGLSCLSWHRNSNKTIKPHEQASICQGRLQLMQFTETKRFIFAKLKQNAKFLVIEQ